jgi:bacteriorhodopsin
MKAGAARLSMRLLVCRYYIQWLCNVCDACGTYVVNWMYFTISEQMVIIYILRLFNQL